MFSSWLQSAVAQASEAVASAQEVAYEASKDFFAMENARNDEDKEVARSSPRDASPLMRPSGIAQQQWDITLNVAFRDSNFFVIPPERIMGIDKRVEGLTRVGILDACRAISTSVVIDPDALAPLATNDAVAKLHYEVMPRFVSDEQFWSHGLWRLSVLRCCTTVQQLVDTYEIITLDEDVPDPRPKLRGADNSALCSELRTRILDAQADVDWLDSKRRCVDEGLRNAGGSCQLLASFTAKREQTELSDSVFESCKYHKAKIASLIGDLETNASKLEYTDLDPSDKRGERFNDLMQQNEDLHAAITAYTALLAAPRDSTAITVATAEPTPVTTPTVTTEARAPSVTGPVAVPSTATTADDGDEFSVKLPWDEDEDDD